MPRASSGDDRTRRSRTRSREPWRRRCVTPVAGHRRRSDRQAGTTSRHGPGMAPTEIRPESVTRLRNRREPAPLDQLPAWGELVPVMDPGAIDAVPSGLDALLGGLDP